MEAPQTEPWVACGYPLNYRIDNRTGFLLANGSGTDIVRIAL